MWYIGAALAFLAGYLYHYNAARAEVVALAAAALAASYLGERLSAMRKAERYKKIAESARARTVSLQLDVEEAKSAREAAEQSVRDLKEELIRLRERPVDDDRKERVERIITEADDEL